MRCRINWKGVFLLLWLGLLGGCGFHLRGAVELPPEKRVIALQGIPLNHPFASYMQQILAYSGGRLVADPQEAATVLVIPEIREDRRELSLDENGKAIEFELIYRLRFEARTPDGEVLAPMQPLALHRIYLNPQVQVIGKAEEEAIIREEMRREAVHTVMRRLRKILEAPSEG
ncbi:MAG: LPS assembly lipoprotein LptE [Methylohalobius sp. ZOD2]|nr:hypothetical protein [Methylothermaceae bacterium]